MNGKRIANLCLLVGLMGLTACMVQPQVAGEQPVENGLYQVRQSGMDTALTNPDANFGAYTKVLLAPLDLSSVHIVQPSLGMGDRPFRLTDEVRSALQTAYTDMAKKYFVARGGYELADSAGPGVMTLRGAITELRPNAPNDSAGSRAGGYSARSEIYSEGAGDMTVSATLSDSNTEAVLARFADRRRGSRMWGPNNKVHNFADVQREFASWFTQLTSTIKALEGTADNAVAAPQP
ncbi:MAG: DUF3313 family protein [Spongiibacteraceae bacterium]|jgi:hypothetical protein|nr:DUF3313 family protein [Spongiibacteraceae bacterium]